MPAGADLGAAGAVSVCSLGVQLALNLSCGFAGVLGKWCVVLWDRGARGGWGEGMRGGVVRNVRVVVVLGVFNPAGTDYLPGQYSFKPRGSGHVDLRGSSSVFSKNLFPAASVPGSQPAELGVACSR